MKTIRSLLSLIALCAVMNACENTESNPYADMSDFEIACTVTGGVYENGRCQCDRIYCDEGDVCNALTNKCPEKALPEVCAKDSMTCSNGMIYRCNANNRFVEEKKCDNGCLPDHSECAECVSDRCEKGMVSKCVGGVYQAVVSCESGKCDSGTACAKECEGNERICKDGSIQICEGEHYKVDQKCEYGCDKNTGNTCASGCEDGNTLCTEGQLKTCSGGKFGDAKACDGQNSCKNEAECGECTNGEIYCVDNETTKIGWLRSCRNGLLDEGFKCNDDHSCDPTKNTCGTCKNGERRCVNDEETRIGHVQICENGKFVEEKTCEGEFSCKNSSACGDCVNNTQSCTNDENELGTEHICVNGTIVNKPCESGNSCDLGCSSYAGGCDKNKCGQCRNGYQMCSSNPTSVNHLFVCKDGRLDLQECRNVDASTPYCIPGKEACQATKE